MKQLLAKLCSFPRVDFVPLVPCVLTLASDRVVLYGNDAFPILVLSTKKQYSGFLKKVFVFLKICLKRSEISIDCHRKACLSLKRRAILRIPSFRRTYTLCDGCKKNL